MSTPNLSDEQDFYFYINDNVKDNLTDLIVSIVEEYGDPNYLYDVPWYQRFFDNNNQSQNIKSFWSVSTDLARLLIKNKKLVSSFHGLQVWACEENSIEDALQFLKNPTNPRPPLWST
jgi:hypothetical protein